MLCSEVAKGAPPPKDLVQGKRVGRKASFRYPNYTPIIDFDICLGGNCVQLGQICGVIAKMDYKSDKISRHKVVSVRPIIISMVQPT
jgi:hypothetical protein